MDLSIARYTVRELVSATDTAVLIDYPESSSKLNSKLDIANRPVLLVEKSKNILNRQKSDPTSNKAQLRISF